MALPTKLSRFQSRTWSLVAIPAITATAYTIDDRFLYSTGRRSLLTLFTGAYVVYQYKVNWSPETASDVHARVARRVVDTCKANEGLYVKFGQVLSSMTFVLPIEYHAPLAELHDKAKTFPVDEVIAIVKAQLGDYAIDEGSGTVGKLRLTEFETEPVASASLAQVHRARLGPGGPLVAVKVQKPNVGVQAAWDLRVYRMLLAALEYAFDLPMNWTFDFTKTQLLGELNFRSEAYHSQRAKVEFDRSHLRDKLYVPEVIAASEKVLVTEWISDSVKITDAIGMRNMGIDPASAVRDAISGFAFQVFQAGHVHCDPHPGNLLVRKNPSDLTKHQVVLIDHGLYVELSDELRKDYAKLWVSLIPPTDTLAMQSVCRKWGIRDFELYGKITSFNPKSLADLEHANRTPEHQSRAKERLKHVLQDTGLFPRPLLFIGRSQNYIRAANWAHGNPIDRVALMMSYAKSAIDKEDVSWVRRSYAGLTGWIASYLISPIYDSIYG